MCCKKSLENMKEYRTFSLGSYAKQTGDEHHLTQDISFDAFFTLMYIPSTHHELFVVLTWSRQRFSSSGA